MYVLFLDDDQEISTSLSNYLSHIAGLISTERALYGTGIALKQSVNDITRIRKDNIRNLPAATLEVLLNWARKECITEPDISTNENLRQAFKYAGLEGLFKTLESPLVLQTSGK